MTGSLDLGDTPSPVDGVLPSGGGAVMASRVEGSEGLDYFPTPPWAARAGGELIQSFDPGAWTCWEPACGEGHMAHGLKDYFRIVRQTDVYDYGATNPDQASVRSFLGPDPYLPSVSAVDWIVTNPPFKDGEAFIRQAWGIARRGVAMLLRLQFIEAWGGISCSPRTAP